MARVGTCKDCGARFKVPDATTATQARCSKCGGRVEIPHASSSSAGEAIPPRPPAAASRPAAPAPTPPAASRITPVAAPPAAAPIAAASSAPATPPARAATRARAAGAPDSVSAASNRPARAAADATATEPRKIPLIPIVIAGVVILGGGTAWMLASRSGKEPPAPEAAIHPMPATTAPAKPPVMAAPVAAPVVMKDRPATPEVMTNHPATTAPAPAPAATTAPPPAQAPAPEAGISTGPRDPVLVLEALPATTGVSAEKAKEWADIVHGFFIDGLPPRETRALKEKLDAIDIIDITPQFINALNGLDMSNEIDIRNAGQLVRYWHDREGEKMHFAFQMDAGFTSQADVDKRVNAIEGWRRAWKVKLDDPKALDQFRLDVEERLSDRKAKVDGE